MPIGGTTIGPLDKQTRDRVKAYRDREGHDSYNEAVMSLLNEADTASEDNI